MKIFFVCTCILILIFPGCAKDRQNDRKIFTQLTRFSPPPKSFPEFKPFSRDTIIEVLKQKTNSGKPLIVHVFVPLCDNVHQRIVPVNESLGNGNNINTNLYWGAMYGLRSQFKRNANWKIVSYPEVDGQIVLQRIIFSRSYQNTKVVLVADAYKGSEMRICLHDFFNSVAQEKADSVQLPDSTFIKIYSGADLIVFNGHNGLMDTYLDTIINTTSIKKDVAVIGCVSYYYFKEYLNYAGGYPLLTTNSAMAPEAYCLSALIDNWADFAEDDSIVNAVSKAYASYQKCSVGAAKTIFRTGW